MYITGINPSEVCSEAQLLEGRGFSLGARGVDKDGKEYVYVQADGAITAGYTSIISSAYQAAMLSTSNDARGPIVGVAPVAFADNEYGWQQVKGPCVLRVAASAAANTLLNTTATAGQLDDDATFGAFTIERAFLTTANGGAAGTAAAILNYPSIGVVL